MKRLIEVESCDDCRLLGCNLVFLICEKDFREQIIDGDIDEAKQKLFISCPFPAAKEDET